MALTNLLTGLTFSGEQSAGGEYVTPPIATGQNQSTLIGLNVQTFFVTGSGTAVINVYVDTSTNGRDFDLAATPLMIIGATGYEESETTTKSGYFRVRLETEWTAGGAAGDILLATMDAVANISGL